MTITIVVLAFVIYGALAALGPFERELDRCQRPIRRPIRRQTAA